VIPVPTQLFIIFSVTGAWGFLVLKYIQHLNKKEEEATEKWSPLTTCSKLFNGCPYGDLDGVICNETPHLCIKNGQQATQLREAAQD